MNSNGCVLFRKSALRCLVIAGLVAMYGAPQPLVAQAKKRTVLTLEVTADPRSPVGTQQQWNQALQDVGADRVVIKTNTTGKAAIKEQESDAAIRIQVQGFVERGKLKLPGGSFSIRDTAGIKQLLESFRVDGGEITLSEKKAFGLTAKQLVWLHSQLGKRIEFSTLGMRSGDAVSKICEPLGDLKFVQDNAARAAFSGTQPVLDELEGLSSGTALAAILRPLGLVVQPLHQPGGGIEVHLRDSAESDEHWPIGWPPERLPVNVEPKLFEKMPIDIRNFPLDKVMQAVQKRANVPFLYDHNGMAREGAELSQSKVTVAVKNGSLLVTIDKLLRQAKPRMGQELRMDENGKGFLWITVK